MNSISNAVKLLNAPLNNWYSAGSLISKIFGYQSVRWRKPRWIPKAPSKIHVVTHRKRLPPDEDKELLRLYQNWKCFMRLTMEHFCKENLIREESGLLSPQVLEQEEEEHRQLMEYNKRENERMALLRKERREKEEEELIQHVINVKDEEAVKAEFRRELAVQKLQETEELVTTFIDLKNLQKAIEAAIDNPVDYNFAMDLDGKIYHGRKTQALTVDKQTLPVMPLKDEGITNVF